MTDYKLSSWVREVRLVEAHSDPVALTLTLPLPGQPGRDEAIEEIGRVLALQGMRLLDEEVAKAWEASREVPMTALREAKGKLT